MKPAETGTANYLILLNLRYNWIDGDAIHKREL